MESRENERCLLEIWGCIKGGVKAELLVDFMDFVIEKFHRGLQKAVKYMWESRHSGGLIILLSSENKDQCYLH